MENNLRYKKYYLEEEVEISYKDYIVEETISHTDFIDSEVDFMYSEYIAEKINDSFLSDEERRKIEHTKKQEQRRKKIKSLYDVNDND